MASTENVAFQVLICTKIKVTASYTGIGSAKSMQSCKYVPVLVVVGTKREPRCRSFCQELSKDQP